MVAQGHGALVVGSAGSSGSVGRCGVGGCVPGIGARVAARMRSRSLDRALIGGADPERDPQLAARAATLTTRPMRARIAAGLERLTRVEREPWSRWRVLPFREAVRVNASELHALAAVLRGPSPVYASGVAMLRRLITDGTGPAYTDRDGAALAHELSQARAAIRR
jgi:hypothetical protein